MPLSMAEEKKVSGHGYYTSSVFNARDLLDNISGEVDNAYALEVDEPHPWGGVKVFKVTITVEEV